MTNKMTIEDLEKKEIKAIETKPEFTPTARQLKTMGLFLDWSKRWKLEDIAKECKISRQCYFRWRRNPDYIAYLQKLSTEKLKEFNPIAERSLMRLVDKGDINAIKLYFEIIGRYKEAVDVTFTFGRSDDKR